MGREPLIVCWPEKIKAGKVSDDLVCLTDVMATIAAITGYDLPADAGEDSYNILPVLMGTHEGKPVRQAIVHHSSYGAFSIRQGRWKLIIDTKGSGGWPAPRDRRPQPGTPGQLYDVYADPEEKNDLWEKRQDIVERLTELLDKYKSTGRSVKRD